MSNTIPVRNLYYLLSYAWDNRLQVGNAERIDDERCPDLESFFAEVITSRLAPLLRRGLDRAYTELEELTTQPKGRLDFATSAKRQTWHIGKMHCSYTELTKDVPQNRIIKSTLAFLYQKTEVSKSLKKLIRAQLDAFSEVQNIRVTRRNFQRIQLHRNNNDYKFILHICELTLDSLLPEHNHSGKRKFRRIEENEKLMPRIFECFVYNFAKKNLQGIQLPPRRIHWQATYHTEHAESRMPTMNTDLTISWKNSPRRLILDCKYYKNAFTENSYNGTAYTRFKTNNLYQIFAYLINKREEAEWENVEGMLLYPTTQGEDLKEDMTILGKHRLQICSINLNQEWSSIHKDLKDILEPR